LGLELIIRLDLHQLEIDKQLKLVVDKQPEARSNVLEKVLEELE
jgi:hypothetical protein